MNVERQASTLSKQEEENNKKFRIDLMKTQHVVWMIIASAVLIILISILCTSYVPPLLMVNNESSMCPDNERSVRIALFCGLFNAKVNKEWFSYTQPFSSVEYLLIVRASPILKVPADELIPTNLNTSTSTKSPTTVEMLYSVNIIEVDQDYTPMGTVHTSDYNKVTFRCSPGNKHCSSEQLFFSTSITSGRYMVRITPLNLEPMKTLIADIKMEMVQLNSDANFFITFIKALLLFSTGFYFYIYAHNKWVNRKLTEMAKEEKQVLLLGVTCLLVNFPTILFSIAITFFFANLIFISSMVSMFCAFLFIWATFFENPVYEKYTTKLLWSKIGFIGLFWAVTFTGFILFAYQYQKNPAFHLDDTNNVALATFYYLTAGLMILYLFYIMFCTYLLWKYWVKQIPRTKHSALLSGVFIISFFTLMLTSAEDNESVFLSSSKLTALLFATNMYTNVLMYLYSRKSIPQEITRPVEVDSNPSPNRSQSHDQTFDHMAISMDANLIEQSREGHTQFGQELPWRDGGQMATIRTLDTKATMKSVSRHSQSSANPISVNLPKPKDEALSTKK